VILDVKIRRPNQDWRWPSWLVLSAADLDELATILRHTGEIVWRAPADMRRCFESLAQAIQDDRKGSSVSALTVRINELLLLLLGLLRRQRIRLDETLSSSRRTVELFLEDLRMHPSHLELQWSVLQMAASCGLKVTQFVFHVRCLTNMTPMHYLSHCRLDHAAKLLLEQPGRSVTDIALSCGFSTSQYFATVFGSRYHCAPKDFRRHQGALAARQR
jgi:AraC family L-rhamnose operon regulatory protein RhaS